MFSFLKKYVGFNNLRGTYFLPVKLQEISEAEEKLGRQFPSELKDFYQEIGAGILCCGEKYPNMFVDSAKNEILPPHIAVDYMSGNLEHPDEPEYYMSRDTYELLEPGDLPFFEIGNGSRYLVMKLNSDNPNAVWDWDLKIEDSFEKFIWRLYYEKPDYYDDIITADLKERHPELFEGS